MVRIVKDDKIIHLCVDDEVATVNDEEIILDSPAFIENDRIYVPVRFLAEVFDADVSWDNETKQVIITKL